MAVVLPSSLVPQALAAANAAATVQVPLPGDTSGGIVAPPAAGGAPGATSPGGSPAPSPGAGPSAPGALVTAGPNFDLLDPSHPLVGIANAISSSAGAPSSSHFHFTPGVPGAPGTLTPSDPGVSALAAAQGTPAGFPVPAAAGAGTPAAGAAPTPGAGVPTLPGTGAPGASGAPITYAGSGGHQPWSQGDPSKPNAASPGNNQFYGPAYGAGFNNYVAPAVTGTDSNGFNTYQLATQSNWNTDPTPAAPQGVPVSSSGVPWNPTGNPALDTPAQGGYVPNMKTDHVGYMNWLNSNRAAAGQAPLEYI